MNFSPNPDTTYWVATLTSVTSSNATCPPRYGKLPAPVDTVLMLVGVGILSLTTVFGNLLIVLAYYDNIKIRSLANIPIVSLAFTDMFIGFYPMVMNTMEIALGYWPLGNVMCNISLTFDYVSVQSSINHIVLINFDRYLSIKSPMKHRLQQKNSRILFKLFAAWFFALLLWAPYINFNQYKKYEMKACETKCYSQFSSGNEITYKRVFLIITSVVGYFIPLGVVLVIYFKMYCIIRQQLYEVPRFCETSKHMTLNTTNENTPDCYSLPSSSAIDCNSVPFSIANRPDCYIVSSSYTLKETCEDQKRKLDMIIKRKRILRHKKSLRMIASIISAFVITGLPLNGQWFLVAICHDCYHKLLFDICNFLTYPNSTVNPFLYAFVSRTFRLQFKKILFCKKNSREVQRQLGKISDFQPNQKTKDVLVSEST